MLSSRSIIKVRKSKLQSLTSVFCDILEKRNEGGGFGENQGGRGSKRRSSLGREPYIAVDTVSVFGILPLGTSSEKKVEYSFVVNDSLPFKLRRYRASLMLCFVSIQCSRRQPRNSSISCSITDFS